MKVTISRMRPYLFAIGASLICLCCFWIVWFYYLRGSESKAQSIYLNDAYDMQTAPLEDGVPLTQQFSTDGPLYGIGVRFTRLDAAVDGTVHICLTDTDSGETVLDATGNIAQVIYDSYTGFTLGSPVQEASVHRWQLSVTADYTAAPGCLALDKSSLAPDGFGSLTENGVSSSGALALLATTAQLGSTPLRGYWALAMLCTLLAGGLALLCRRRIFSPAILVFLAVLMIGLCYQFVLPAYSAPDEATHYHTAYQLSNRWLGVTVSDPDCNFTQRECDNLPDFTGYRTTPYTYRYMLEHFFEAAPAGAVYVDSQTELITGYMIPYFFSAAGITLARLLHFGGVATAFFGRLWNLAFLAAMAALAVRLAPRWQGLFAAVALLPVSLHLGGSYSYDSFLLALALPLTALCLRCALQTETITRRQIAAIFVLCFFIAPMKSLYVPLCLLVLLIPAARYGTRRQRLITRLGAIGLGGLHYAYYCAGGVLARLASAFSHGSALSSSAAESAGSAATAGAAAAQAASVGTYSIFSLLRHPGTFLSLLCNTFFPNAEKYAASLLGGQLGYLNLAEVQISGLILIGFLLLLLLACLPCGESRIALLGRQRAVLAFVFAAMLGLVLLVCIQWTPASYDALWGFQGRYLLPVLPCLLLALPLDGIRMQKDSFSAVLYGSAALELLTLLNALAVIYQR